MPKRKATPWQPSGVAYQLADGTEVRLSLSYAALAELREADRASYDAYNEAMANLEKEPDLQSMVILHTAYLCWRIQSGEGLAGAMDQKGFLSLAVGNRAMDGAALQGLLAPNPPTASAARS